ncbi:hypothetical protein BJ742DRAFT_680242, partial [Cladochytrium replicatum]
NNEWVHVFPEGRLSLDVVQEPPLHQFRWGIARLIMESETPPLVLPFWHQVTFAENAPLRSIFTTRLRGMDKLMPEYRLIKHVPLLVKNVDVLCREAS